MQEKWTEKPYLTAKNVEIYYSGNTYNLLNLVETVEIIENKFFKDFNIQNTSLNTPIKMYLTTTRNEWLEFYETHKEEPSNYCLERQADINWYAQEIIQNLVLAFIKQDYIIKGLASDEIANALGEYYANLVLWGNDFENKFNYWFIRNIINKTGNNEYKELQLIITYLIENGKQSTLLLQNTNNAIKENIENAKHYYIKKYKTTEIPEKIEDIKTVQELMLFTLKNIATGYKSLDGKVYIDTYKDFHKYNSIQNTEEMLISHVGTCIDQAGFIVQILNKLGYETKMFYIANYGEELKEEDNYKMLSAHIIVLYKDSDNKWVHLEVANSNFYGIKKYDTLNLALTETASKYFYHKFFHIYEINELPIHSTLMGLHEFAKLQKEITYKGNTIKEFKVNYK